MNVKQPSFLLLLLLLLSFLLYNKLKALKGGGGTKSLRVQNSLTQNVKSLYQPSIIIFNSLTLTLTEEYSIFFGVIEH